jgi:hypothetical protein
METKEIDARLKRFADAGDRSAVALLAMRHGERFAQPKTITYYACALTPDGRLGQLQVTRVMAGVGICASKSQEWTGVVYHTDREAQADLTRLNCQAVGGVE